MAALVWFTMGIAIWHFTVFVPDRFWQGIMGAFLGTTIGAMVSGGLIQVALDRTIGQTDLLTVFAAIPGTVVGAAIVYVIGMRQEAASATSS